MYKVVIVDDEEIIVEGLVNYIKWEDFECEVVAVAEDGASGIDIINEYNPDIVFTDISMPNVDGLTMVEKIKENHPDLQVTVITGYRDFESAQRAIKLGVNRIVTKPTKMEDFNEALETMISNIKALAEENQHENASAENEKTTENNTSGSFVVNNALKYIEENYFNKLTLMEVAENTYVSQWHLSKLLKKHTNLNFCDLLNQTRIKHAKHLLEDPALKIHEISDKVGFSDVTHFSKIFKKQEGMTPNDYRNNLST